MSTNQHIDMICMVGTLIVLLLTLLFVNGEALGIQSAYTAMGYESQLFDTSKVHTIDIIMDDWEDFLKNCQSKEYEACSVVIDNQAYKNVAIRAKGNNSLSSVASYGNDRYSFKIEFDHYDSTKSYYGLDKLSLTSLIQDNTMMKDYLVYQMMADFGVDAPLCSYVYITVNGEDWGLYLATEGVEQGFLQRNYGSNYGDLYKPDSMNNTGDQPHTQGDFIKPDDVFRQDSETEKPDANAPSAPDVKAPDSQEDIQKQPAQGEQQPQRGGENEPEGRGNSDVKLQYIDDDPDSYSNIFDNAKTDVTDADKQRLISSIKQLSEGTDLESVLNMDEILRYFVVHNFVCNFDSYTGQVIHNYYLYEKDGVLSMIPWDYNLAFGSFQSNSGATELVNFPIDSPVSGGDLSSRPMVSWIFSDTAYTEQYHQLFAEFLSEQFDSGAFERLIDTTVELISPYVEKDPTKFCTYEEFATGAATLKEFCMLRAQSVSGQLAGTIPADSEGQSADSSALIDASSIDISATGSMNGGSPGGGGSQRPDDRQKSSESMAADTTRSTQINPEENSPARDESQALPLQEPDAPNRENGGAPEPPAEENTSQPFGKDEFSDVTPGSNENRSPNENSLVTSVAAQSSSMILLLVSLAVLLMGLAFALLFKRR
ncbi:MAG: CotH kinase family protein [Candidatus Heteroscillospira sp.]|jgi:spore coat protein CotH